MASPRGRGLRPGGLVRALGRLILLVAVGFGVGLVFGLVTEEPELFARHLQGESEAVALREADDESSAARAVETGEGTVYSSAAGTPRPMVEAAEREETAGLPRVAAAVRATEAPVAPTSATTPRTESMRETTVASSLPVPESARSSAAEAAAATRTDPRAWSIQVGAFSDERAAEKLADALSGGYPVEVLPAKREGDRWRVRVQPIAGEDRARKTADKLKREEGLPTWVTPMDGRGRSDGRGR